MKNNICGYLFVDFLDIHGSLYFLVVIFPIWENHKRLRHVASYFCPL
nr:MAG TPA: Late transcription unit A [Caudoviricetes sp.]DAX36947.1 MAG TPA: Late transcription unit A [Caudoviricetes sp.]